MFKIIFLIGLAGILFPFTLSAKIVKVTVQGEIKGLGDVELLLLDADRSEIIRTMTRKDHFRIETDLETGDLRYYTLYAPSVGPLGPSMTIPTLSFFIDSPKITIRAEIKEKQMKLLAVKGSPGRKEYDRIVNSLPSSKGTADLYATYNQAFHEYNEVNQTPENLEKLKKAGNALDLYQGQRRQEIFDLLPQFISSMPFATLIASYFGTENPEEAEKVWVQFAPSIRHCYALKKMEDLILRSKNCAVGHEAPDFELPTPEGKLIRLSSLQGKYVLIDFWASWCGPCRKEIPNVKKVYAEFKDKGLQVVGISIDQKENAWKKALGEEKAEYLQLIDLQNITSKLYNYNGIPFIILISPEGRILEKDLRGEGIRDTIVKYLK